MASGYDISASSSYGETAQSSAGPATSGGIGLTLGNTIIGGSGASGGFKLPESAADRNAATVKTVVITCAALAALFLFLKYRKGA